MEHGDGWGEGHVGKTETTVFEQQYKKEKRTHLSHVLTALFVNMVSLTILSSIKP